MTSSIRVARFRARKRREGYLRREFWVHKDDWAKVKKLKKKAGQEFPNQSDTLVFVIHLAETGAELVASQPPTTPTTTRPNLLTRIISYAKKVLRW